ncbi:TPA: hypothetical protein U1B12_001073 [Streptococcus suis]|uniref:hypothetical protein n=1 Tax=Streptococcus suis TaxID=1307 RepID=UPI00209AC2D7|nr:hypothetical protein [Streptococcus suis]MCO8200851.1 hypothetical protein [Streptococcus suis]MCO8218388.1 hypothetical protein [Streptococcus suis]HEM3467938.1 hypothetical protein [Streptococcus suis]HEM3478649.1 hypothetical protein [Streptococcus suis]
MYNQTLIKTFKVIAYILGAIIVFSLGYGTSSIVNQFSQPTSQVETGESGEVGRSVESKSGLTSQLVTDFLIAYYTKKDLGENQSRYKPFMTEGLYNATVAKEEEPIEQAYKGYAVDQVFESATIYINQEESVALVQVRYSNKLLEIKNNRDGNYTTETSQVTLKLTYSKSGDEWLVNMMDNIIMTDTNSQETTLRPFDLGELSTETVETGETNAENNETNSGTN